jgi:tripartite-type tricarboxylate transporter receptor subunit TctC
MAEMTTRRALLAAPLIAGLAGLAHAQAFPSRTVTIVVPFVPGGSNDIVARFLAQQLQQAWGSSVVVENRGGAGGAIGANQVARAAPDGHTVMLTSVTFAMNYAVQGERLPYDALRDFAPVALIGGVPLLLAMAPTASVRTPADLFAMARSREMTYASVGPGSVNQFATELMNRAAGLTMRVVQYRGGAQAMNDVLAGHVDFYLGTMTQLLPLVREGRLIGVATTGRTRSPAAPDIPTLIEAGLTDVEVNLWWGVLAPSRTPPDIVAALNAAINRVLASQAAAEFLAREGATPTPKPVEGFATMLGDEVRRWQSVARQAGITPQ